MRLYYTAGGTSLRRCLGQCPSTFVRHTRSRLQPVPAMVTAPVGSVIRSKSMKRLQKSMQSGARKALMLVNAQCPKAVTAPKFTLVIKGLDAGNVD